MPRVRRFLIAPLLWWTQDQEEVPGYEQTAWQRGRAATVAAAKDGRVFGFASTVTTCAFPAAVGFATTNFPVVLQVVLIALAAASGYLLIPIAWAAVAAIRAPALQRDEARVEAAKARDEDRAVTLKLELTRLYYNARTLLADTDKESPKFHNEFEGLVRGVCAVLRDGGYSEQADLFDYRGRFEHAPETEFEPVTLRVIMLAVWTDTRWIRLPPGQEPEVNPDDPDHARTIAGLREELEARRLEDAEAERSTAG